MPTRSETSGMEAITTKLPARSGTKSTDTSPIKVTGKKKTDTQLKIPKPVSISLPDILVLLPKPYFSGGKLPYWIDEPLLLRRARRPPDPLSALLGLHLSELKFKLYDDADMVPTSTAPEDDTKWHILCNLSDCWCTELKKLVKERSSDLVNAPVPDRAGSLMADVPVSE
ncbi:hypothetical protein BU23DRAFT_602038 [Bimuria novae-zelandiae CBS 107.79]|uniref:Uncharacterized protein n=1 Tax=Bimuria novae-zelandiae CBS 107.79 TaxID=1447943 RepID=A0A6A5UY65_9PLEO|nr:hypothetical protein BU23DRAFT_602038 [Bimuria novae-zelandiae CBS 107.79]